MPNTGETRYELYYWPSIQGRGELVRLPFEDAGVPYVDVARLPVAQGGGAGAITKMLGGAGTGPLRPFAPPILVAGDLVLWQTASILAYVGPRLGLVPADEESRARALALQLTIADFLSEIHDTHHPIGGSLYYEDQKPEAARRSAVFLRDRLPKLLGYFEDVAGRGGHGHLLGSQTTYPDLSIFQVMEGLAYAFPKALARIEPEIPRLCALRESVRARPGIAAYLASERRIPFNQQGIFRHYPELDAQE